MKKVVKCYRNDELTVVWQPDKCIHSRKCFHGLPAVFNPEQNLWIKADNDTIIPQAKVCPSAALSLAAEAELLVDSEGGVHFSVGQWPTTR